MPRARVAWFRSGRGDLPQELFVLQEHELEVASKTGVFEDAGWRVRKNGTLFWANVVITVMRDSGGKLSVFAKVTRDLTQRRAHEEDLRRRWNGGTHSRGGKARTDRETTTNCSRAAPMAVNTCARSSGGGSTAFRPRDWSHSS